jgi:hypothetical protein
MLQMLHKTFIFRKHSALQGDYLLGGQKTMKKIIGILVITLLISTAMTTIAVNEKNYNLCELKSYKPTDLPDDWLEGADQYQTDDYRYGMVISPVWNIAQEFKPTKEDLTAVALYFFNLNAPSGIDITLAIRDSLDGIDLTSITINADNKNIKKSGTWVMFDFDDITIIPEETYYIVCYASSGVVQECYCWFFDVGNKYDRGIAWQSSDSGETWHDLEEVEPPEFVQLDQCFITYYQEPPESTRINNFYPWLFRLMQRFPILKYML